MKHRVLACVGVAALTLLTAAPASAGFISYVIREGATTPPTIQPGPNPGSTEFIIAEGGQKAALGSSDIDGTRLGDLLNVSIVRHDDPTRFTAGSGPAVAPYLNLWITDGLGNFAVIANEPSNPEFNGYFNNGYNLSFGDLADKTVKVYENSDLSWLPGNGVGLTFGDLANFIIQAPTATQLQTGWAGLGSGAPRELGTNQAYGVNWVFGDTLSNYVSGDAGYIVSGASVTTTAVPEPSMLLLAGVGALAFRRRLRQR